MLREKFEDKTLLLFVLLFIVWILTSWTAGGGRKPLLLLSANTFAKAEEYTIFHLFPFRGI